MKRLGIWLIGLILLSIVSNFFLPYTGFATFFGWVITIVLWLAYYGYVSYGLLMAGKWAMERQQALESGEVREKTKRKRGREKNDARARADQPLRHAPRRARTVRHRYYTVPPQVTGRYRDE